MKRSQFTLVVVMITMDTFMTILAFLLAHRLRMATAGDSVGPLVNYLPILPLQVASVLIVFLMQRLYYRRHNAPYLDEFYTLFGAVSVATLMSVAFTSLLFRDQIDYHRWMMIYLWALTLLLVTLGRILVTRALRLLQARGIGQGRVLLIGTGDAGRMILQKILHTPNLGYHIVGVVDSNVSAAPVEAVPLLGTPADIPQIIEDYRVDEVIVALPEASHQEILGIVSMCEREKVSIRVFPDVFQIMANEVSISDFGGLPLLTVRDVALRGWKLALKRTVDVVGASLTLLFISPVMMLTALLIKLESPGPVFYVQERMGLDAKPFPMLKFRSMRADAETNGPGWTVKNDPRRTRFGAIIRRISLDELPQFINVLVGDMSLVGPRPERPVYVEQFRQRIPRYMDRHREKAGLTGWAQVNGLRGDTSVVERTKYDVWYIENWSLALDFKIMIQTVLNAARRNNNAY
ncbi:undecaprenyl-phosphate glucose phosphotransferase [Candidatus Amarolinea dominans]|uniref:undecaprenyl-phosphate glucose phosphotransferase n=1 Tax=Candidatus Amarolinea dominans TaxID=3140696 RepID=UPI0031360FE1|nr:undecaprenyl-phosphate glucose phosphotransferase [Anaerolineae bacterium]